MLSSGERPKCAVECASRESEERLLHQKLQVHFPDPRHLVQEDQSAFEEGVDLAKLGREYCGVQFSDMPGPEIKILFGVSRGHPQREPGALLPFSIACRIAEVDDKPSPGQNIAPEACHAGF